MKNRGEKLRKAIDLMSEINNSEYNELELFNLVNHLMRINRNFKWQYSDTYDKIQGVIIKIRQEMELFKS